ncbi:putative holin-like toxin [Heyndrickxia sporothermodurans]|uniref:Holin-like toxin n=1 Tax=Heyndrickxia sporothermodurans TaxID=46224 RepID=A0A150KS75_9BACI|nr:hypothetical protein B4102_0254 [Heyndrickxia sporothermodurans]
MGGNSLPSLKGGDSMTVYETLVLMVSFATLIVAILSQQKK